MSLHDQEITTTEDYSFFTGTEDFVSDLQQPKQDMNLSDELPLEEIEVIQEAAPEVEKEKTVTLKAARSSAKFLTTAIDAPLSSLLAFYAKEDDADDFKCDQEERDTLEEALTEYLKDKGADIPPGMMLLVVILSIYGSKTMKAFNMRKQNILLEKKEAELAAKDQQIKLLQAQVAASQLTEIKDDEKPIADKGRKKGKDGLPIGDERNG